MIKTGVFSKLFIVVIILTIINLHSCGLFDKEIRQDEHIAQFKRQLNVVGDSLKTSNARIEAYKNILENIQLDKDIISLRKRNMLLVEGHFYISKEYAQSKNYTTAIDYSNKAITLDSTNAKGYFYRGCIYHTMRKDSLAVLDYTHAIFLDEDYTDAYYNRGIIRDEEERHKEALADYDKVIKLNPVYITDVYNNRGNTYFALSKLEKALDDYSSALDLDSMNIKAYTNRIGVYITRKEFEKALNDCNRAIRISPSYIRLYYQRATTNEMMKNYEEAIADYEKVLELDMTDNYGVKEKTKASIKKLKTLMAEYR